jgi:glycerophosphoryl diester phosphodiesterase
MRPSLICAALVVLAGTTPAVTAQAATPESSVNASSCYIPQLIAHRGGGGVGSDPYKLENSWPAFENSVNLGVKVLETDVRWTKDGVPILMHDADLSRTTTGTGNVQDVDIAYIDSLELKNGAGKIPHFEEFLTWSKSKNVQVWPEYKPEPAITQQAWIDDYAQKIKASGADAVVPSFNKPELEQFKTLLPGYNQIWFHDVIKSGFSVKPSDVPAGAWAGLINVVLVNDPKISVEMGKADITLYAWFNILTKGDDPAGWDAMAKQSPAGIITDYPEQYQQWATTTDYCKKPKKQKAKCAKLPKSLSGDSTVVILKRTCKTNAGQKVTVSVSGKGKLVKGKKGKVSVKTDAKGKVKITLKAKKTAKYSALKQSKSYSLK